MASCPTILVVDDERDRLEQTVAALAREGYMILPAHDAHEALRLFDAERPDLIIADLAMPGMNGLQFIAAIKARSPQTGILAVTPNPSLASAASALRCGALDLLVRPIDSAALHRSITRALEYSRLAAESRRSIHELEKRGRAPGEELPASQRRILAAFNGLPDALMVVNRAFDIVAANEAAAALFGVPAQELIGRKCCRELGTRGDIDPGCPVPATFATGGPALASLTWGDAGVGGGRRSMEVSSYPLASGTGAFDEVVVRIREAPPAPRAASGREDMMGILGRLADGLAHDFNNQLTIIKGCAEFLLEGMSADDSRRKDAARIMATVERGTKLVRQLLAFSRSHDTACRSVSLAALVDGLVPSLRPLLGERILLRTLTGPDLWPVRADHAQIEQVIMNLIINARDAMTVPGELYPVGTITMQLANVEMDETTASCRAFAEPVPPGAYVMLAVSDTGCGIASEVQPRIFEPFFTTKECGKGTGLGLSAVLGIVKGHHGYVFCESEPGRGSTFRVFLPRDETREEAPAEEPAVPSAAARGGDTVTALVVEDDEDIREVVRRGLERVCHRVHEAADVEEAVAVAARAGEPIQLLVTDMVMPGGTGLDLAERLRATFPGLKVLFISGYFDGEAAVPGAPGTLFLQKPFGLDELARKASELMEGAGTPAPRPA